MSCHPFFSAAWFVLAWELMPKCGLRGSGNADAADANTFSASTGLISWNPYPTPSGSASVPPSSREPNTGTRPARRLRSQELCPVQEFKARIRSGNSLHARAEEGTKSNGVRWHSNFIIRALTGWKRPARRFFVSALRRISDATFNLFLNWLRLTASLKWILTDVSTT